MRPERAKLTVEPDTVQILEAAFKVRITLDVIEDIACLWLGQEIKALARIEIPKLP